jgi:hypothetical protein
MSIKTINWIHQIKKKDQNCELLALRVENMNIKTINQEHQIETKRMKTMNENHEIYINRIETINQDH